MLFLAHCSATIVETGHAACHHCAANNADSAASTATQQFSITLTGGLASTSSVEVWHTSNATMFEHALDFWRQRVPAYFWTMADGPYPHHVPRGSENWNDTHYGGGAWCLLQPNRCS